MTRALVLVAWAASGCTLLRPYPGIVPEDGVARCANGTDDDGDTRVDCDDPGCLGRCAWAPSFECPLGWTVDGDPMAARTCEPPARVRPCDRPTPAGAVVVPAEEHALENALAESDAGAGLFWLEPGVHHVTDRIVNRDTIVGACPELVTVRVSGTLFVLGSVELEGVAIEGDDGASVELGMGDAVFEDVVLDTPIVVPAGATVSVTSASLRGTWSGSGVVLFSGVDLVGDLRFDDDALVVARDAAIEGDVALTDSGIVLERTALDGALRAEGTATVEMRQVLQYVADAMVPAVHVSDAVRLAIADSAIRTLGPRGVVIEGAPSTAGLSGLRIERTTLRVGLEGAVGTDAALDVRSAEVSLDEVTVLGGAASLFAAESARVIGTSVTLIDAVPGPGRAAVTVADGAEVSFDLSYLSASGALLGAISSSASPASLRLERSSIVDAATALRVDVGGTASLSGVVLARASRCAIELLPGGAITVEDTVAAAAAIDACGAPVPGLRSSAEVP